MTKDDLRRALVQHKGIVTFDPDGNPFVGIYLDDLWDILVDEMPVHECRLIGRNTIEGLDMGRLARGGISWDDKVRVILIKDNEDGDSGQD